MPCLQAFVLTFDIVKLGLYLSSCAIGVIDHDETLVNTMTAEIQKQTEVLKEKEKDAIENHGDNEVMEAELEIAKLVALTGTLDEAVGAFEKIGLRSLSTGQRIDLALRQIILGIVWMDVDMIKKHIEEADELMEKGGDWDRRNRLKIYKGLFDIISRNFEKASEKFLSGVATFTAFELCSYNTFVFYTVITSMISLTRVQFKEKIIDSPDILAVIDEIPYLKTLCNALYEFDYKGFFISLVDIENSIRSDRYFAPHTDWFFREIRLVGYTQFLESYKCVTISSMAAAFGVSCDFIDRELARFIASGRVSAKIDNVSGVVETCRLNETNSMYERVIKQGDLLLNRIQLLSRSINM